MFAKGLAQMNTTQSSEAPARNSLPPTELDSGIRSARAQAAVVRSLLDELDDALPPSSERLRGIFAAQAVEEIAQLGHKLLTLASMMAPQAV